MHAGVSISSHLFLIFPLSSNKVLHASLALVLFLYWKHKWPPSHDRHTRAVYVHHGVAKDIRALLTEQNVNLAGLYRAECAHVCTEWLLGVSPLFFQVV